MDAHREACRRQHRVFGHYAAVQAWLRGLDCIAMERLDLEVYLGLKRFKSERITWLLEDLVPWFPYQSDFYGSTAQSSLHSLFLSRVPIGEWLPKGSMTTAARVKSIAPDAPKTELFVPGKSGQKRVKETDVVRYLAVLDSGLLDPNDSEG